MKKILLPSFLALSILLSFVGCGSKNTDRTNENSMLQSDIGSSNNNDSASVTEAKITAERAKEIAFEHAGVKEADVRDLEVELDKYGSILHYDVDFESASKDYEYDINADDGKIISSKAETDKNNNNTASGQVSETEHAISKDAAKDTAFKHAEVKEADVHDLEIDLDYENGITVYEIDFKSGGYEYSYDINADTGAIVFSEKERD